MAPVSPPSLHRCGCTGRRVAHSLPLSFRFLIAEYRLWAKVHQLESKLEEWRRPPESLEALETGIRDFEVLLHSSRC